MRTSFARYCLVTAVSIALSGCYSGGRWTVPNLAFWKSNPFSGPTSRASGPEAVPRPSELATQPGPAPGTGYASYDTSGTLAPTYPTTPASFAAQQPYPVTHATPPITSPYMAPQHGYYDPATPSGAPSTVPYTATNPYANTPGNQQAYGANPHSPVNHSFTGNPHTPAVGHQGTAPPGATAYGAQGTTPANGQPSGYAAANPSGLYANPVRSDGRDPYDARLADYRSSGGPYGSPVPDYRSAGGYQSPEPDYRNQTHDWNSPGAQHPQNHAGTPYGPPTSASGVAPYRQEGYAPGNTGYAPPGVPPYQSPIPPGTPTHGGYGSDPGYSPGSVGRYGS